MTSELPPQIQNQIAQLQQVQQQVQALSMQKSQIEAMQKESKMALEELERLADDAVIYRSVGELVIKTTKEESVSKLKDREETSLSGFSLSPGRKKDLLPASNSFRSRSSRLLGPEHNNFNFRLHI